MKMTKLSVATTGLSLLLLTVSSTHAFSHVNVNVNGKGNGITSAMTMFPRQMALMAIPTPEESAKALSEYMAKSHVEKLKAVKIAEEKKNAEIEASFVVVLSGLYY